MIVKMKKATIVCRNADQEACIAELGHLGLVHVENLQEPGSPLLTKLHEKREKTARALELMLAHHDGGVSADTDPVAAVTEVIELQNSHKELLGKADSLSHELHKQLPFGSFDPAAVSKLADEGIAVKLYRLGPKAELVAPEGAILKELSRDREGIAVALISSDAEQALDATEQPLPARSLDAVKAEKSDIEAKIASAEKRLADLAGAHAAVAEYLTDCEAETAFEAARSGMTGNDDLAVLRGYLPERDVQRLRDSSKAHGWAIVIEAPAAEDKVPTKIENPKIVTSIKAIFDMTGLVPGYAETDISLPFLIFLSIFFAMLVGDAGYGLLFIGLTAFAKFKKPKAPAYIFNLLFIMSACTVIWGALSGTWFGINKGGIPHFAWFDSDQNIMGFCFLLGAIHLSVAHIWRFILTINTPQCLAQLGWTMSTWVMFFAARVFVLGADFPSWAMYMLIAAVLLILCFSVPPSKLKQDGISLAMLPLDVINNFTDVVSYIRLSAVGTASFAVANSFNEMLTPMFGSIVGSLIAALLLFGGHALNIALCGLGILVHGVRLNTLEFSSHMGMEWTGSKFNPFIFRKKTTNK